MPLNNPIDSPTVRHPRMKILCNGQEITSAIGFECNTNNYFQADTFTARFSLNKDPNFPLGWWGRQEHPLLLDIQASLDGGDSFESLIVGQVDHMAGHIEKGLMEVDGRDMTANFIDTKTQMSYQNLTASQIVQKLAASHGMQADVTPTTVLAGRYYEAEHERIGANGFIRTTTEWNLICSLAQGEEFDVWVTGNTIHFHPAADLDPTPYIVMWDGTNITSNTQTLTVQRSLGFAKDIVVTVRSWYGPHGRSVTKYAPSGARQAAIASGKAQEYTFILPNLTEAEAQDKANRIRAQLTKFERLIQFTRPADFILTARNKVRLQGTNSSWDQDFFVDSIVRSLSFDRGFTMTVKLKNADPNSTVVST